MGDTMVTGTYNTFADCDDLTTGLDMENVQRERLNGDTDSDLDTDTLYSYTISRAELESIFAQHVFDMNNPVLYLPIRHHSPGCSHHLLQMIARYEPEIILIEGPEAGDALIPVLSNPNTVTPVSLYYTYEQGEERAAFYFPLLDYSPEYVAIGEAARLGIPAKFIDLNYRRRSVAQDESEAEPSTSYQDEHLLTGSSFMQALCHKLNCRSFDELWDRWFESGAANIDTFQYMQDVFVYCTLSRLCYTSSQLEQDETLSRERHMLHHIQAAQAQYNKVLVLTGGFHTYGLIQHKSSNDANVSASVDDTTSANGSKTKRTPELREQIYPMVYTFQEADRLNGYASGMPYVAYYDQLWQNMQNGINHPASQTAIVTLSRLAKELRSEQEAVSTSDAIEAYSLFQGLAILRGRQEGGVYELLDSVTSCFIKGERTLVSDRPLDQLRILLTGDRIGEVAKNSFTVPIVEDFKRQAAACKLQLGTTGQHKKVLDLYTRPRHRQISRLLHMMEFLGTGLAVRQSGPDWISYTNINLMRETWMYSYSSYTEARLIEHSIHGGTLAIAATRRAEQEVAALSQHNSGATAEWLLRVLLMELEQTATKLVEQTRQALRHDGSFLSLCRALTMLERIHEHRRLLGLREHDHALPELLQEAYHQAVAAIDTLQQVHPDDHNQIVQALKQLYMLSQAESGTFPPEPLYDRLSELLDQLKLAPALEGVSVAILSRSGYLPEHEMTERARAYMQGTPEQVKHTAAYLQGVFAAARDAFLYEPALLTSLNQLLSQLSHDDFVQMIPELRLAFTFFTPTEMQMIASQVASLYSISTAELEQPALDEALLQHTSALDQAIRKEMERWIL
ncbi:DUF5682 family protein [Paenibacillus sp. WLX2291]|uniref:DUF5682 family protein n=1 Tax=Paenibacillus sp. WLX2291 TaxID=3296934 RepID=UPI0039845C8D